MAKHRAPRSLKRLLPALLAALLVGGTVAAEPASAITSPSNVHDLSLVATNGVERLNCVFDVRTVNYLTGQVTGNFNGRAYPNTLGGYLTFAANAVYCVLFANTNEATEATLFAQANHPTAAAPTQSVTVGLDPAGYTLCGAADATLNNGSHSVIGLTCVHS